MEAGAEFTGPAGTIVEEEEEEEEEDWVEDVDNVMGQEADECTSLT